MAKTTTGRRRKRSTVNKKKSNMKYPILSTKSADGKITKSITKKEKLISL